MIYDVTLDGRTARVDVVRDGAGWRVRVGEGEWTHMSADEHAGSWVVDEGGRRRQLAVALRDDNVHVLDGPRSRLGVVVDPRDHALDAVGGGREGVLRTAMPGAVVRVLVAVGDVVEKGAVLVVVEAMKMQNEFRAPLAGTVAELPVAVGVAVDANAVLAVLTPSSEA